MLSWKSALQAGDIGGIIDGIGVVESKNKILVLVSNPTSVNPVRQAARTLGIPDNALAIGGTQVRTVQNLQTGSFRPTIGGIRISAGSGGCTLWGNAVMNGVRYGVTNSHCTSSMGSVTPDAVSQAGGHIGTEAIDPPWTVRERHSDCINGYLPCRYSDAAAFTYDGSASSEKSIANVSGTPCGYACYGPMEAVAPNRQVTGVADYPMDGEYVDKVGSTTGWTRGYVQGSCFDIKDPVVNRRWLCTIRVVTSSYPGDSGSPVFFPYGSNARMTGILWGADYCRNVFPNLDDASCPSPGYRDSSYPANAAYVSAWWAVRQELGIPDLALMYWN